MNRTGLYRKGDGSPVDTGQIHARVHNYDRLFVRAGGGIRLRETDSPAVDGIVSRRFDAAMLEVYAAAMRKEGYPARRFLAMVRGRGASRPPGNSWRSQDRIRHGPAPDPAWRELEARGSRPAHT